MVVVMISCLDELVLIFLVEIYFVLEIRNEKLLFSIYEFL